MINGTEHLVVPETFNKQPVTNNQYPFPDVTHYYSPSNFYNFCRNDPFQDVLNKFPNYFREQFGNVSVPKTINVASKNVPNPMFKDYIQHQGHLFEAKVKDYFKSYYKLNMVELPNPYQTPGVTNQEIYQKTMEAMHQGVDIIYQGVLYNSEHQVYGHPDFIIRSDKFNILSPNNNYPEPNAPSKFGNFHYIILDTKFKTLNLNANRDKLLNSSDERYYKLQIYIYSLCLAEAQGDYPRYGYIIGRGYRAKQRQVNYRSNFIFDRLGPINIADIESESEDPMITDLLTDGIEWLDTLDEITHEVLESVDWENPDETYYRPNLTNDKSQYNDVRNTLANLQGEPTMMAYIGNRERQYLHDLGIYNLRDKRCTTENMGHRNQKSLRTKNLNVRLNQYRDTENKLPNVNFQGLSQQHLTSRMPTNVEIIETTMNQPFLVVDIEKTNNVVENFNNIPYSNINDCVYMIGVHHSQHGYKSFISHDLSQQSELANLKNFVNFLSPYYQDINQAPYIMCWGNAERGFFTKLLDKHAFELTSNESLILNNMLNKLVDMCKFFEMEQIIVKGAYTFKLKDVAKNMHRLGYINTTWHNEMDGMDTIVSMITIEKQAREQNCSLEQHPNMYQIVNYNSVDCIVVYEMVKWLQSRLLANQN